MLRRFFFGQVILLMEEVMHAPDEMTRYNLVQANPKLQALLVKVATATK
jgi:hypothetical protein